jgi:ubiquinone/menaquinone biosynthesis C-methylase UbiE
MCCKFDGERLLCGMSPKHLEIDHIERYKFAAASAKGMTVLDIACGTG